MAPVKILICVCVTFPEQILIFKQFRISFSRKSTTNQFHPEQIPGENIIMEILQLKVKRPPMCYILIKCEISNRCETKLWHCSIPRRVLIKGFYQQVKNNLKQHWVKIFPFLSILFENAKKRGELMSSSIVWLSSVHVFLWHLFNHWLMLTTIRCYRKNDWQKPEVPTLHRGLFQAREWKCMWPNIWELGKTSRIGHPITKNSDDLIKYNEKWQ